MFRNRVLSAIVAILAASLLESCLGFVNMDLEKTSKGVSRSESARSPPIRVVVSAWVDSSGGQEHALSPEKEREKLATVFETLRSEYEFLANARTANDMTGNREGELTLRLHVNTEEDLWGSPYLSGYSLFLFPFVETTEREFSARLLDACGTEIASHDAAMTNRVVYQMHLLYLAPLNLHLLANPHPWHRSVRNLLDRMERDLSAADLLSSCT